MKKPKIRSAQWGVGLLTLALALDSSAGDGSPGVNANPALHASAGERFTPAEILALPAKESGTGTSGVAGIQTRLLHGSPTEKGLYTIQLVVPPNTRIEAHTHPDDRVATVIQGNWFIGYGSEFDEGQLRSLPLGSFYTEPSGVAHFARTGDVPVIVEITGYGPSGTEYVAKP